MSLEILMFAVPGFLLLILMELFADWRKQTGYYRFNDAWGSLALGIVSRTSKLLWFTTGLLLVQPFVANLQLLSFSQDNMWHWLLAFVLYDLSYYWFHRVSHNYNFMWAGHVVHHQSEEFNLTTALRQSSSGILGWVFSVPLLILGVPVEMLATCNAFNLIYQFWVHTRFIDRLGWMEQIFVTPSHHRVHHGVNAMCIDKNHGGVFIIWDKLFGSFQEEPKDVKLVYGASRPTHTFNPIVANLQFWGWLFKDAWHTNSWNDKLTLWFRKTGWRPADVQQKYPVVHANTKAFVKFDPATDNNTRWYAFLQLVMAIPLMTFFLMHFSAQSLLIIWGGFVFISLPLVTTAMMLEGKPRRVEYYRMMTMWPVALVCIPVISTTCAYVFFTYLTLNSLLYIGFWGFSTGIDKQQVSES